MGKINLLRLGWPIFLLLGCGNYTIFILEELQAELQGDIANNQLRTTYYIRR